MKALKFITLAILCATFLPLSAQVKSKPLPIKDFQAKFGFSIVKKNPYTSVKNQAQSGTCWDYAGVSFIESEMLRKGLPEQDIAEMYIVYFAYKEKAEKYVRMHGNSTFSPGGEGTDVLDIIKKYGAVPQEVYSGLTDGEKLNNHNELQHSLNSFLDTLIKSKTIRGDWRNAFDAILNRYLGCPPSSFTYKGKQYTPRTYADDVLEIKTSDYVYITSWTHTPYYEKTYLEVPDNWAWEKYYNLPLDDMVKTVDNALEKGFTVLWSSDMSEEYFSVPLGIAVVPADEKDTMMFNGPKAEKVITPLLRQKAYNNYTTVDDHVMHIVGSAKDVNGKKYYLVKNSWGTQNRGFDGMYYVSENFLRFKTISIIVNKESVPAEITKKLK
ncbi:MAG: C1 family peptidase [Flavobacteriales bacterium]|nr:C1 family peptidase [Flavobacteriales bacterium]